MATETQNELTDFYQFVGQQVANRNVSLSPEQALALWRHQQEELAAIREGLADVEAGRTRPVEEFVAEFRERHDISEDT